MEGPHLKSSTPGRSKRWYSQQYDARASFNHHGLGYEIPSFEVQGNTRRVVWKERPSLSWHVTAVVTKPEEDFEVFSTGSSDISSQKRSLFLDSCERPFTGGSTVCSLNYHFSFRYCISRIFVLISNKMLSFLLIDCVTVVLSTFPCCVKYGKGNVIN